MERTSQLMTANEELRRHLLSAILTETTATVRGLSRKKRSPSHSVLPWRGGRTIRRAFISTAMRYS